MIRAALLVAILVWGAGCAGPRVAVLSPDIPSDASLHPVYVAKSGLAEDGRGVFDTGRAPGMQFARAVVSIPSVHEPGEVLWPNLYPPTPDRHFVLAGLTSIPDMETFRSVAVTGATGERVVLVHGFNVNPSEAVYSAAQIHKDFELDAPIVAFSWPSAGRPRGYIHDRDSVLFARSDLARVVQELTTSASEHVSLVGHSMGAALIMEALRELALRGDRRTLSRISSVVFVAPDLDPDVFRRQARDIGALPQPFVVFVAANDEALRLASFFSFERRLGAIQSAEDIGDLTVTLIDVSAFSDGQHFNHDIALSSPSAIKLLKGVREGDPVAQRALEQYLVSGGLPLLPD